MENKKIVVDPDPNIEVKTDVEFLIDDIADAYKSGKLKVAFLQSQLLTHHLQVEITIENEKLD